MPDDTTNSGPRYVEDNPANQLVMEVLRMVIVGADVAPDHVEELKAAGAWEFLTKPFDAHEFLALVDETMEGERTWGSSIT